MISRQFLFLFSALGAINGIFLACYFFSRRPYRMADLMLGALLLAIGVRTGKSTFFYFNPDLAVEFLQFGLSACLLIGPLTYLYLQHYLADANDRDAGRQWRWHLGFAFLVVGLGVLFPYAQYRSFWRCCTYGIHAYWGTYLVASAWQLWQARESLQDATGRVARQAIVPLSVYFSSCLILACYISTPVTSYIVGALSFTFSVHMTVLVLLLRRQSAGDTIKKEKYLNRKLSDADALALLASLDQTMREQKLHLNPNLSLAMLAKKIGSVSTTVSQVLNDRLNKSFNHYVNEYRIAEAKQLLVEAPHFNMDMVAERCGFNSSSTFFAAFKKVAGQTPASYRAALTARH